MKIGLNAISLRPGRMGGVESYFRNLLFHFQQSGGPDAIVILCNERDRNVFPLEDHRLTVRTFPYSQPSLRWILRGFLKNSLKYDPLSSEFDRLALDIIHHPFTVLDPMRLKTPSVLTFWDMQQEFYPEYFSGWELAIRKATYKRSAELARYIIVSSAFTRQCLVEKYGIREEKIDVIPIGPGPEYRQETDETECDRIAAKYSLTSPFLYYPAAFWPHKNHKNLLLAFRIIKERHGFDGKLVLTGANLSPGHEIEKEIARVGLQEEVKILGFLPHTELPCLYHLARMLVFPSLFEGFGIPLVEAMACGCPVVCADVTSIPEVVGDAGVLFDPRSPEDMAEKIVHVWSQDVLRETMRKTGLARARLFEWERTVRSTKMVYEKAAAGS